MATNVDRYSATAFATLVGRKTTLLRVESAAKAGRSFPVAKPHAQSADEEPSESDHPSHQS